MLQKLPRQLKIYIHVVLQHARKGRSPSMVSRRVVKMLLTFVLPFLGLLSGVWAAPHAAQAPTATIDSGVVFGKVVETAGASVNRFLGIPFAASPVRFASPTKPTSWSQPYDATNFSDTCPQQFNYPEASRQVTMMFYNQFLQANEGEDCLNLNIWTPASGGKNKTVMVWIYGVSRILVHLERILMCTGWSINGF